MGLRQGIRTVPRRALHVDVDLRSELLEGRVAAAHSTPREQARFALCAA